MKTAFSRVFVLEVDGKPTLGTREAQQLCKEPWLLDDLWTLTSGGVRLRTLESGLSVRPASPHEGTIFSFAANSMEDASTMW
jgi:hypothetical protein